MSAVGRGLSRAATLLRTSVVYVLYYLGVLHIVQAVALRNKAVVLMYHRVLTPDDWAGSGSHPGIVVTDKTFDRHLRFLKRRFNVLSLSEFADRLLRRLPFENSSCLITFDDGWKDNLTNALPLLRRHDLPAVIFLPVNFMGTRRQFWREALTNLLVAAAPRVATSADQRSLFADILTPVDLADVLELRVGPDLRQRVIDRIAASPLARDDAERLVERLSQSLGLRVADLVTPDRFLDWTDLAELSQYGVAFGGHGAEHVRLTDVSREVAREEIERSRVVLSGVLGRAIQSFSYPNGAVNEAVTDDVRAAGYQLAFTTEPGLVDHRDDPLGVRRINLHEGASSTIPLLMGRMLGLL